MGQEQDWQVQGSPGLPTHPLSLRRTLSSSSDIDKRLGLMISPRKVTPHLQGGCNTPFSHTFQDLHQIAYGTVLAPGVRIFCISKSEGRGEKKVPRVGLMLLGLVGPPALGTHSSCLPVWELPASLHSNPESGPGAKANEPDFASVSPTVQ